MSLTPDALTANAEIEDRLGEIFGLEFDIDPEGPLWFSVDGVEAIRQIEAMKTCKRRVLC
jgi:hypothetical protein